MQKSFYFFYLPLYLSANKKIFFNITAFSLKVLFIFLGLGLFLTNFSYLKLIGFWIFIIYLFYFLFFLRMPNSNFLFERVNNITNYLEQKTKYLLLKASIYTELFKDASKLDIFLAYILLDDYNIKTILEKYFNIDLKYMKEQINDMIKNVESVYYIDVKRHFNKILNKNIELLIYGAYEIINKFKLSSINNVLLFLALLRKKNPLLDNLFSKYDVNFNSFLAASFLNKTNFWKLLFEKNLYNISLFENKKWFNKNISLYNLYFLNKFGSNLILSAKLERFPLFLNREEEIKTLIKIISEENQVRIVLKGDKEVGKKTLIYYLAYILSQKENFENIFLIEIDLIRIYLTDPINYQENITRLLNEAISYNKIILFLSNFEDILLNKNYSKILEVFLSYIKDGKLNVILTINNDYRINLEKLIDLNDFKVIEIQPHSLDDSFFILLLEAMKIKYKENILVYPKSLELIINLSFNFIKDKNLPYSAIWLLSEAVNFAKFHKLDILIPEIIGDVFSRLTNINVSSFNLYDKYILENLEDIIHQKYVNQNYAIKELSYALKRFKLNKLNIKKPIVLFFIGPIGVGKTYLSEILASIFFGSKKSLLILDGNDFQNDSDIFKLIGDKENNIEGMLVNYLIKNPYILILLKNFERFNKNIIELFASIFINGYIKDDENREIDFSNSIIVCETSLFSNIILESIKDNKKIYEIKNLILNKLIRLYSYEFLSLFTEIIIFEPLGYNDILDILNLNIKNINLEFDRKYHICFDLSRELKEFIIKKSNYRKYGAKKLEYIVNRLIINKLNKFIKSSKDHNKAHNIFVDIKDNKISLEIIK
jgi:ATP-dependent Clp protease ATP-binding subunit ClpC